MFEDRNDAARQLALALVAYRGHKPLILAIPRGAVPMARIIAEALQGDCDVVLVRKLGAPGNPELAIGAVDETGWCFVSDHAAFAGADAAWIEAEQQRQLAVIRARRQQYTPVRAPMDPAGRVVIVVDDGLATGATMKAALHGLRQRQPARLVCAVPVAPSSTLREIQALADEVVCLETPEHFIAVGQHYREFPQVSDAEVLRLLSLPGPASTSPNQGAR